MSEAISSFCVWISTILNNLKLTFHDIGLLLSWALTHWSLSSRTTDQPLHFFWSTECRVYPSRKQPARTLLATSASKTISPWWWLLTCSSQRRNSWSCLPFQWYPSWISRSSSLNFRSSCPCCCVQCAPSLVSSPLRRFLTWAGWSDASRACSGWCIRSFAIGLLLVFWRRGCGRFSQLRREIAASLVWLRSRCFAFGILQWSYLWVLPNLLSRNISPRLR